MVRRDAGSALDTVVDLCRRRLPERMGIPTDQIQVLSPTRRRGTGTAALNQALQQALNPPLEGKGERRFGDWVYRAGDRVMQVKNSYDILWREDGGLRSGMGMFNGDIGVIRAIDGEQITVDFDGKIVESSPDMLGELEPAFAITVHKSQGSEYRAVILALSDVPPTLLARGVLYTAITRARELFIVVGSEELIAQMVANDKQTRRYSALRTRLLMELYG
jgi:exodeoxyribonuclease V alpha subunit